MITIDMHKAKQLGHTMRRQQRAEAFAPLDELIEKQIPGHDLAEVEASRQKIRTRDALVQRLIDAASTPAEILEALAHG